MRVDNKAPKKGEIFVAITTGNKSPVGGVVIGGNIYQNCTIILQGIKTSNYTKNIKDIKGVIRRLEQRSLSWKGRSKKS